MMIIGSQQWPACYMAPGVNPGPCVAGAKALLFTGTLVVFLGLVQLLSFFPRAREPPSDRLPPQVRRWPQSTPPTMQGSLDGSNVC